MSLPSSQDQFQFNNSTPPPPPPKPTGHNSGISTPQTSKDRAGNVLGEDPAVAPYPTQNPPEDGWIPELLSDKS
jgi:hypothetical protein